MREYDIITIGGGLSGLAAAQYAARTGRRVLLLEKSRRLGGRGDSTEHEGVRLNLGPHALYRGGLAEEVLRELGVPFAGGAPGAGSFALVEENFLPLPGTPLSLLTTPLLSWRGKRELASFFWRLRRMEAAPWVGKTRGAWLASTIEDERLRGLVRMLARVASYSDGDDLCAGMTVAQLKLALGPGVLYLHGGWRSLVEGLSGRAQEAGVSVETEARVESVEADGGGAVVQLAGGEARRARAVILAGTPRGALGVLRGKAHEELSAQLAGAHPVRAACLDVALSSLPEEGRRAVFGMEQPLYFSVHSGAARLGPRGVAVLHAAKYLSPSEDGAAAMPALASLLDAAQPGWRGRVVAQRSLPSMEVYGWRCEAARGGCAARPSGRLAAAPSILLAGDWVGPRGLLVDAALASAREAARRAVEVSA